jgi:type I restriction enzyme S subunit
LSWRETTLGGVIDLFDSQRVPLSSNQRSVRGGEYPYYGAQGIIDWIDGYIFEGRYLLIPEDGENLNSRKLPIAYFADGRFWVNNHAHIVRGKPGKADDRFIKHWLNAQDIKAFVTGAAQPKLSQGNLKQIPIRLPAFCMQRRIADILSAYDDLIENSTRRIAILEDIARRMFEEWFFKDAKTGRWVELETLCEDKGGIQTGPFGSQLHKYDYSDDGVPVVMPKNMADLKIREEGIARIKIELANTMPRHILRNGDIVYGRRGDIGRRAFVTHREDGWFCGTGCLKIRPDESKISPRYLFDALGLPETDAAIKGRAHGATMPNLSAGLMKSVPVFLPTMEVQARYAGLVDPLFDLAASLEATNSNLRTTRDLLLPKLISGEIEVRVAENVLETAAA